MTLGASAGGVEALKRILSGLPRDLQAALFVVLHVSPASGSLLAAVLGRATRLPVLMPVDGQPFRNGHVYVARPDRHLILEPGRVRIRGR